MRFRLTYAGALLSSNPLDTQKRIEHKHDIRRVMHRQLKELWRTDKWLSKAEMAPNAGSILPANSLMVWPDDPTTRRPMAEVLGRIYGHSGYKFVPLVRQEIDLACTLRVLCLRRDGISAVSVARDIDNRIKTLIDALTMPSANQGSPMKGGVAIPPGPDEDPFYVLLDDDRQVTHLEVETDTALELDDAPGTDESFVRLFITVEIRPVYVTMFNLSFA